MQFARNITWLRQKAAAFPAEVATAVNIDEVRYREYEAGDAEPSLPELVQIGRYWNIPLDDLLTIDLETRARNFRHKDIKLLALDVDGVLTDGGMYFGESGEELKKFDTKDGRAIINLGRSGVPVAIISSGTKLAAIENRAKRLGVKYVYVGLEKKEKVMEAWLEELGIGWEQVAYVGDDVNDRGVIARCGLTACPADAISRIKREVDVVLTRPGGRGAVREFVEEFLLDIE